MVVLTILEVLHLRRIHENNRSRVCPAASRGEFLRLIKRHIDLRRENAGSTATGGGRRR